MHISPNADPPSSIDIFRRRDKIRYENVSISMNVKFGRQYSGTAT